MKVRWKGVVPVLAVAGMLLLPMSVATALDIDVDGSIIDWLPQQQVTNIYSAYNPGDLQFTPPTGSGVACWREDGVFPPGSYVDPGYGGQNYDVEAMYAYADDSGLYVAVVTGFDPIGVNNWYNGSWVGAPYYEPGDLFFDFNETPPDVPRTWDLAIETYDADSEGHVYQPVNNHSTWYSMGEAFNIGPNQIDHNMATDKGDLGGSYVFADKVVDGTAYVAAELGENVTGQWDNQGDGAANTFPYASEHQNDWNKYDHNVLEVYLSSEFLASLGFNDLSSITVQSFWTEDCGNDWGQTPVVTVPQVPEPVTMVMLGCLGAGMLGARAAARRRKTEK